MSAYTATGASTVKTPIVSFSKSLRTAAILPWVVALRKTLISNMLADATEPVTKKGIRIEEREVNGLKHDIAVKAKGTGIYVAIVRSVFDTRILSEPIGRVFVYSNPLPSALNKAKGRSRVKIPPIEVAMSTTEVCKRPKLEISKEIRTVSRAGRAKKKAVAGFLEAIFKSLRMKPVSWL